MLCAIVENESKWYKKQFSWILIICSKEQPDGFDKIFSDSYFIGVWVQFDVSMKAYLEIPEHFLLFLRYNTQYCSVKYFQSDQ